MLFLRRLIVFVLFIISGSSAHGMRTCASRLVRPVSHLSYVRLHAQALSRAHFATASSRETAFNAFVKKRALAGTFAYSKIPYTATHAISSGHRGEAKTALATPISIEDQKKHEKLQQFRATKLRVITKKIETVTQLLGKMLGADDAAHTEFQAIYERLQQEFIKNHGLEDNNIDASI